MYIYVYIYLSHACPIFPLLWPCGKIDITCSGVKKTPYQVKKNPYQVKKTHIKPYHTFYCWPIVRLLLKNGRPCVECPSHDVSPLLAGP